MTTVGGRLLQVRKRLGDRVAKGEVVAVMDDEEKGKEVNEGLVAIEAAKSQVARLEREVARVASERLRASAELRRAEVELRRAQREHTRNKALFERGVITASAWDASITADDAARAGVESARAAAETARTGEDAARAAVELARVQVRQAEARVETLRVQLRNTRIRAPFAGMVNQRYLDPGAFLVSMNPRPILQIVVVDPVIVRFKVPERDLPEVRVGKPMRLRVDAYPQEAFAGKVTRISAALEPSTRSAVVEATLANADRRLRPGMFARVEVTRSGADRITLGRAR
jgi:multidrug resistance efflux pump